MKRLTNRHKVLLAAGSLTVGTAVLAETVAAQPTDIRGTVAFEGGEVVPKGQLKIHLEDPAVPDVRTRSPKTQLKSNGGTKTIDFSLSLPTSVTASPTLQIVARLERGDGWLLARGSAKLGAGTPVEITLYRAMY